MTQPFSFPVHFSRRAAKYRARRPGYPWELVDWLAEEAPGLPPGSVDLAVAARSWEERRRRVGPHPEAISSVSPEWQRFRDALERARGPQDAEREIRWPLAIRAGRLA